VDRLARLLTSAAINKARLGNQAGFVASARKASDQQGFAAMDGVRE